MYDPYSPLQPQDLEPDIYKDLDDDARRRKMKFYSLINAAAGVIGFLVATLICALLGSCQTEYITTPPEVHQEHHWHTDSVIKRDSVHTHSQTTVMQLDSAAMARYGIQLKAAERAWLVKSEELEYRLRELAQLSQSRDSVRDSIPVPYPVEKKVPAELTWWESFRIHLGNFVLYAILLAGGYWIVRKRLKILG